MVDHGRQDKTSGWSKRLSLPSVSSSAALSLPPPLLVFGLLLDGPLLRWNPTATRSRCDPATTLTAAHAARSVLPNNNRLDLPRVNQANNFWRRRKRNERPRENKKLKNKFKKKRKIERNGGQRVVWSSPMMRQWENPDSLSLFLSFLDFGRPTRPAQARNHATQHTRRCDRNKRRK